jgi:tRNA/tmRNA/rRNA uracil-C5-methylase (TrmA/RlmC/RlmD family)
VAFCACDPVTLARDLRILAEAGYELRVLEAFDMFPHTHHVETLAWLTRPGSSPSP